MTGNPNTGKSTIFNELTGARQKIGNWPGVTVDKKVGYTRYKDRAISIVDLPGTYSVNARSPEEKIVIDYLMNNKLDLVMDVVDSSNIERNLFLTVQLLEQGIPLLIDLNMQDDAARRGIKIDVKKLEEAIGMPVVETVGRSSKSTKKLLDVFTSTVMSQYHVSPQVQEHIDKVQAIKAGSQSESDKEAAIIEARYALIDKIMAQAVDMGNVGQSKSEKIDHFLANGFLALPIFLLILYAVFQITFTWIGQPIADFLDDAINTDFVDFMTDFLTDAGVADWMVSLVCDGIISGVGAVLTFVPLIFVLFFCLSFLDGTGYMARIAFIMDPIMRRCGLTGKGVMPLMMGFGCGVPAIMGARALDSEKDRMVSILVTPFLTCGAKLPIMALFAAMFFPDNAANVVFAMYVIGMVMAIVIAKGLGSTVFKDKGSTFLLELPPYRMPQIGRVIVRSVRDRTLFVLARAAAVAAPAGVLIWILANVQIGNTAILSHITAFLDPAARVFGIDGVILLAFILGFPANELVMPLIVMGYLSSGTIASGVDFASFRALLLANGWTVQTALCTLVLTVAHAPCSTTCLTILRETRSAKWTLAAVLIPAGIGLALCILIHCMFTPTG